MKMFLIALIFMVSCGVSQAMSQDIAIHQGVISRDGFIIHYTVEGHGPPIVVYGGALYFQRVVSKDLAKHFKLIFVDNRVTGAIAPQKYKQSDYELDRLYDDINAVKDKLGLKQFAIMGHSGNALIVMDYAKRHPKQITHVILVGSGPGYGASNMTSARLHWNKVASPERKAALATNKKLAKQGKVFSKDSFLQWYAIHAPLIWYDYNYDPIPLWKGVALENKGFDYIWGKLLPKLNITANLENFHVPVAVMLGKYDGLAPPIDVWRKVRHKFNHIQLYWFEESGHTPMFEESELFNSRLIEFMKS